MASTLSIVASGITLGLSAGISPGPLLTLVITETLRFGIREGIKVAIAPILTDLPIMAAAVFVVSNLASVKPVIGGLSLLGAFFLVYLGIESLRIKGVVLEMGTSKPKSIRKGMVANFLNPNPYLFWFTLGGPLLINASDDGWLPVAGFITAFYLLLVGSKVLLAVIAGKSGKFLKSGHYIYTVRVLGIALILFAAMFARDGLILLGILG